MRLARGVEGASQTFCETSETRILENNCWTGQYFAVRPASVFDVFSRRAATTKGKIDRVPTALRLVESGQKLVGLRFSAIPAYGYCDYYIPINPPLQDARRHSQ